ncbi:copper chaperone PCu(A)C [Aurantiacibacter sp. D1-12]|uniref:copper chaperone PCu(A)C n=1 Tax=Aurantiacibacter sp. D1-12 TaxID=2993658 RepID=UPI00237D0F89|nr:copper chaperone PCu(A)C [Aurantiacibacter sp. D1-12]MDE1466725.1 copper chaperone PCu(A)C [Aurantiacibacter sp. D1-12]
MNSKQVFSALTVSLSALALAACDGEADAPVEEIAAGDCPPGITVENGWLAMPAVAGNPAAAYFTITNGTDRTIYVRAANMVGSESATLHMTVEYDFEMQMQEVAGGVTVEPEATFEFEPGGTHVMVMGLSEEMEAGAESELTLTFAGGDKCSFPVTLYPAGTDPRESEAEEG